MSDLDVEILVEFLVESRENLDQMERELVVLERDPGAQPALHAIFRAIHTIKGTAGFLGLDHLQHLAHVGESLLSRLRDGELPFTPTLASLLLRLVDAVRGMLTHIERHQAEGADPCADLAAELARATDDGGDAPTPAAPAPVVAATALAPPAAPAGAAPPLAPPPAGGGRTPTDPTIRVDVGVLDQLVNLAGELVLARNRLAQYVSTWTEPWHLASWQRLHQISSQLQEQVMKTRMQPIGAGWAKLPRTVRDLASQCGKQVRIEMEGGETELDRTLIEAIRDPLTHALRNAIDHGIESPSDRQAACKEAEGVIRLRAYHDSGQVHIEIADDGAGIRPDRVRTKAVERGVIAADDAARMSDADLVRLVFQPGFSTAAVVTSVSGRGVGMDVVRSNIEKIGGQVDLASVPGEGTTLRITVPLTLAILPALIVESGGQRYAVPQAMLRELVRIDAGHPIEHVHDARVFRLRGRLLPLIDLAAAVGDAPSQHPRLVMVIATDGVEFGLIVDRYHDSEEIVVKPLGRHLRDLTQYGGATILGDGRVVLIVDARTLARRVNLLGEVATAATTMARAHGAAGDASSQRSLVLVRQGEHGRFAVPLEDIDRIAEVPAGALARTGADLVVQLHGDLLPVMRLADALGSDADEPAPLVSLIVCGRTGQRVGVAVDQVLDIVDLVPERRWSNHRLGVSGTVIVDGGVVELLDLPGLIASHAPHLCRSTT